MATLTIRNVSADLVERIKDSARRNNRSMEQEIRQALGERYETRERLLQLLRAEWPALPPVTDAEVERWMDEGRT